MAKTIEEWREEGEFPEKRPRNRQDRTFFADTHLEKNPFRYCPWCETEGVKNHYHTHNVDGGSNHECGKCGFTYTIYPLSQDEYD